MKRLALTLLIPNQLQHRVPGQIHHLQIQFPLLGAVRYQEGSWHQKLQRLEDGR